jgi:polygalacturonase
MKPNKGGQGRIKFGTESTGGFRNVTIANCTFRSCKGLALEEVDGGIMENISISNLTMMDVWDYPIYITLGRRNNGPQATNGSLRNISIANVVVTGVDRKSGIQITGLPNDPIEGIRLQNIRLSFVGGGTQADAAIYPPELGKGYPEPSHLGTMPAYGLFARHVKDLELADIHFSLESQDLRPAIVCVDVAGLEIDHYKAQLAPGIPAGRFDLVTGLKVLNSPVLERVIDKP